MHSSARKKDAMAVGPLMLNRSSALAVVGRVNAAKEKARASTRHFVMLAWGGCQDLRCNKRCVSGVCMWLSLIVGGVIVGAVGWDIMAYLEATPHPCPQGHLKPLS